MDPNRNHFPHQDHIKDEPVDEYEREPAPEMRLTEMLPEPRESWGHSPRPEGSRQTLYNDVHDRATAQNFMRPVFNGNPSVLSHPSASNGNTFHIPPFRYLAETAGAGEYHLSSASMLPSMRARHDDRHMTAQLGPALHMPPDGAFLLSDNPPLRNPGRPMGQYDLPKFPPLGNSYALDRGHAHAGEMPTVLGLPLTMDPSRLLQRQIPLPAIQAESGSESEVEVDNGADYDDDGDQPEDENDDGWGRHPDTIGVGVPRFHETKTKGNLRDAAGVEVPVQIHAGIVLKKSGARQENFWILYRRNYFGVQTSYTLRPRSDSTPDGKLYLHRDNRKPEPIRGLYMVMRGVVEAEDGPEIKIVQFNAKRKPTHAGDDPPPIEPKRMKPLTEGSTRYYAESTGDRQDHLNVPMNYTFPRNQFRAATQNNGARRADQQRYHIVVELKAEILVDGVPQLYIVASSMSEALVVRGRCPLSFKTKHGHTQNPSRKGRRPPRDRDGNGTKGRSTTQNPKEGQAKGASRGFTNKTGGSSQTSIGASTNLPSLTYGTMSRSTNTGPVSPRQSGQANGTVNRETIPRLESKLLSLSREYRDENRRWESEDPPS